MLEDILVPLTLVGLAELGDKTHLSVLLLSSKTEKHLELLFGVILGFLVVDGIAVVAGQWIVNFVPANLIKILAGTIFIILGILILRSHAEELTNNYYLKNPFLSGFSVIFLSEWGDKTQIASGLFATKYNPLMVLIGVMISLTIISILTIYLGKLISNKINPETITKIAGILFILIGISFFFF